MPGSMMVVNAGRGLNNLENSVSGITLKSTN
jgi:hypothetical protein